MSVGGGWWRTVEVSGGLAVARRPPETPTRPATFTNLHQPSPTSTGLVPIAHSPDPIARVVAHQQRSIRHHEWPNRSPPARPVGQLPSRDEVLDRDGAAVLHLHPHNFGARWYRAIPRAMKSHERITGVVRGKPGARVEREAEWRRVRLHRQRRRLDAGAVESCELGVGVSRKIALRPAVPLAVLENVQMLGWDVVAQVVAVVIVRPKLTGGGVKGEAHRVAEPPGEDVPAGPVQIEARDRRSHRVLRQLDAHVARRASG